MAHYIDALDVPLPIEEAFDYLADFSRTAEWDPGVSSARRLTPGPSAVGSTFEVQISFLGKQIPLEYRITEFDHPSRVVLTGGNATLRSIDEITLVSRPGGTRISYEARLELTGIRQLADPLLHVLFQRIGRLAMQGLRQRLAPDQKRKPALERSSNKSPQKSARARA